MNAKLWAVVAASMVILTGTGLMFSSNTTNDGQIVIVARANEEGSGLFAKTGWDLVQKDASGNPVLDSDGELQYNVEKWKGIVLMSPGNQSIQHLMLMDLVENKLGLDFVDLRYGNKNPNAVNVLFVAPPNMASVISGDVRDTEADGGIVWESYYSAIIRISGVEGVFTTGDFEPHHTCCVVSVNRAFAETSTRSLVNFLAAYIETVNWIKDALDKGGPNFDLDNYYRLIDICKTYTGITETSVIESALYNVNYIYDDGPDGLNGLKEDIANLTDGFDDLGGIFNRSLQDIGFQDSTVFADWLVDDMYLRQTQYVNVDTIQDWSSIRVTVLIGDLHGIAITVGKALKIFEKYKVDIKIGEQTNGQLAMDDLLSGNTDVAVIGAPPSVVKTVNMYRM